MEELEKNAQKMDENIKMENNLKKMDEFLDIYSKIGEKKLLAKDVSDEIMYLKDKVRELADLGMISISHFDFESDEKFLVSVNRFTEEMYKKA